jgi:hypothetical protein
MRQANKVGNGEAKILRLFETRSQWIQGEGRDISPQVKWAPHDRHSHQQYQCDCVSFTLSMYTAPDVLDK